MTHIGSDPANIDDASAAVTGRVQALYKSAAGTRASFRANPDAAAGAFADYVDFVERCADLTATSTAYVIDVGCGCGWSAHAFAGRGRRCIGVDVSPGAFEPGQTELLRFLAGSAMQLPLESGSADVVAAYQCLEHIPDPAGAVREMVRSCRPGGTVAIVGPNLISPVPAVTRLFRAAAGREPISIRRLPGMPRHPYGNTLPEVLFSIPITLGRLLLRFTRQTPLVQMREPDTNPPFHGDNDACFLCNPLDVARLLREAGCEVIRFGKFGRGPAASLIAGGTWVAARKR